MNSNVYIIHKQQREGGREHAACSLFTKKKYTNYARFIFINIQIILTIHSTRHPNKKTNIHITFNITFISINNIIIII
jgi:hypothetical protein